MSLRVSNLLDETLVPDPRMLDLPIIILAGGHADRFGGPKGLAELGGKPVLSWIIERLRQQSAGPIILNADPAGPYKDQELELLPDDEFAGEGPLAGILTALRFARAEGYKRVLTTPIDTPLLPLGLIAALAKSPASRVAMSAGRLHPVCGLWNTNLVDALTTFLKAGGRSAYGWVQHCRATPVSFSSEGSIDPFVNINSPTDLQVVRAIVAETYSSGPI